MSTATVFGLYGAVAVGLGLYGLIVNPQPLRKILAFNLLGTGVFLLFGVMARRGAAAGVRRRSRPAGEGRLVLADGLVLAVEEHHDAIVNIATLTGAFLRALGDQIAGVLDHRPALAYSLVRHRRSDRRRVPGLCGTFH